MSIEHRHAQLEEWAAEQRETDRNYRPLRNGWPQLDTVPEPEPCEKYWSGCSCKGCERFERDQLIY